MDSDYIYVGFYIARNANVIFSDVQLTTSGVSSGSPLKTAWNRIVSIFPF